MLERRRRSWSRWALPGALALVVVLSAWAWRHQPVSTQLQHVQLAGSQFNQVLRDLRPERQALPPAVLACPAWRLHLRLDPGLRPPGSEWMMFEGATSGSGYELHWLPDRLSLQLIRAPDRLLLGTLVLDDLPNDVVFVRRGLLLQVWINGRTRLNCIDPASATPLPIAWGFRAAGGIGDGSSITLIDDRELLTAAEREALAWHPGAPTSDRPERLPALLQVRHALLLDPAQERTAAEIALASAFGTVLGLPPFDADQASLMAWLDWGSLRLDLLGPTADAQEREREILASLEHLESLARKQPAPESLGLFLNLLPDFARLACERSRLPRDPNLVLTERDQWLRLLRHAGQTALRLDADQGSPLPERWRWQLRLTLNAASCLMGREPDPLPSEAPDWVVCRWRTLAGSGPGRPEPGKPVFNADIPLGADEQNPILPVLNRLLDHAAIDATAAEGSARLIDLMERYTMDLGTLNAQAQINARRDCERDAEAIFKAMPEQQALLGRALLVLRRLDLQDLVDVEKELSLLDPKDIRLAREQEQKERAAGRPLMSNRRLAPIENDPLAYALYRLILSRLTNPRLTTDGRTRITNPISNPTGLPETHTTFASLLSGAPEATSYAWKVDPAVLPPPLALAAALAMQEVAGLTPEWRLLERTPSFTVPLRFLLPPRNSAPGLSPSGSGTKPNTVP